MARAGRQKTKSELIEAVRQMGQAAVYLDEHVAKIKREARRRLAYAAIGAVLVGFMAGATFERWFHARQCPALTARP